MDAAAAALASEDIGRVLPAATAAVAATGALRAAFVDPAAGAGMAEEWAALARGASEPNVFLEPWFMLASLRHLPLPADLALIEVRRGDTLIGLLPIERDKGYARLPVRYRANWLHFHSFLGTPLISAGAEREFWIEVLRLLDAEAKADKLLHLWGLAEDGPVHRGLVEAARALGRPCDVVHRAERALLETRLPPDAYYEQTVRKKKRKELKRLSARLDELGKVEYRTLASAEELAPWCDAFLELERAGWKGERGSALGCDPATAAFFREAVTGAFRAGRLDFLRLDLDGRPLAMLVNFLAPPGSFSFKIAIDEEYGRFSPGVLIQIENLKIVARDGIGWMDSCAAADHPMINSLWGERRSLVRVTVPLKGPLRRAIFLLCRLAERASAALRGFRGSTNEAQVTEND